MAKCIHRLAGVPYLHEFDVVDGDAEHIIETHVILCILENLLKVFQAIRNGLISKKAIRDDIIIVANINTLPEKNNVS